MPWHKKNPDLTNNPLYLEPRVTAAESQLAQRPTHEEVDEKILTVNTGGTIDLSYKADIELVGINDYSTVPTFTDGRLTQVEELDGAIVKKRTTLTYNDDGTVKTVTEVIVGKTIVSTMNYVNGEFSSVSKQLTEGGL